MKYNIFDFDQQSVISLRRIEKDSNGKEIIFKIDVIDLLILNVVSDYMNRKSIEKIIINDKIYFWISYKMIIEDLPILDIKKQALADRLDKLVYFNLLEKYISRNEQGTKTCFRIGDMYEILKYNRGSIKIQGGVIDEYEPKTINTKNNSTNTIKEDTIVSKKEKYSSITDGTDLNANIDTLYGLYPSKCPKRNVSLGKCFKDKDRLRKLLKNHSFEMLKFTIEREIKEKYNKSYMSNFSTFLNNLPDYGYNAKNQNNDDSNKSNGEDGDKLILNGITYK